MKILKNIGEKLLRCLICDFLNSVYDKLCIDYWVLNIGHLCMAKTGVVITE